MRNPPCTSWLPGLTTEARIASFCMRLLLYLHLHLLLFRGCPRIDESGNSRPVTESSGICRIAASSLQQSMQAALRAISVCHRDEAYSRLITRCDILSSSTLSACGPPHHPLSVVAAEHRRHARWVPSHGGPVSAAGRRAYQWSK